MIHGKPEEAFRAVAELGDLSATDDDTKAGAKAIEILTREASSKALSFDVKLKIHEELHKAGKLKKSQDLLMRTEKMVENFLHQTPKDSEPKQWAKVNVLLGSVRLSLWHFMPYEHSKDKVLGSFRSAEEVFTREDQPLMFADIKQKAGDAYITFGHQTGDKKVAVAAFKSGIEELEKAHAVLIGKLRNLFRSPDPTQLAKTKILLGKAYLELGKLNKSKKFINKAMSKFDEARKLQMTTQSSRRKKFTEDRVKLELLKGDALTALTEFGGKSVKKRRELVRHYKALQIAVRKMGYQSRIKDVETRLANAQEDDEDGVI